MYRSQFTDDAKADIRALPKNIRNSLKKEFERIVHVDPRGCSEKLGGELGDFRSFHYEEYRIVFRVFEDIKAISVVGVGKKDADHHAEIYRQLETLARNGQLAATVLETYRSLSARSKS